MGVLDLVRPSHLADVSAWKFIPNNSFLADSFYRFFNNGEFKFSYCKVIWRAKTLEEIKTFCGLPWGTSHAQMKSLVKKRLAGELWLCFLWIQVRISQLFICKIYIHSWEAFGRPWRFKLLWKGGWWTCITYRSNGEAINNHQPLMKRARDQLFASIYWESWWEQEKQGFSYLLPSLLMHTSVCMMIRSRGILFYTFCTSLPAILFERLAYYHFGPLLVQSTSSFLFWALLPVHLSTNLFYDT